MTNERGLVISCPISISGTSLLLKSTALDPQELRFALLFWDKLNFPVNNAFHVGLDPNAQFLADAGVLDRLEIRGMSGQVSDIVGLAHVHAYKFLDNMEPGKWSLGTGQNSISFPERDLEQGRGILVRLYNAIPVPDKDVPLQDILEFRTKYRDELIALRYHLEVIYQRIVSAGDGALAIDSEINALEQAIADHIKVSKKSGLAFVGMSFDAGLNVLGMPASVAAGLAAYSAHLGFVGSLLAGAATLLTAGPGVSLRGHKADRTPFRYISSFHSRVF